MSDSFDFLPLSFSVHLMAQHLGQVSKDMVLVNKQHMERARN